MASNPYYQPKSSSSSSGGPHMTAVVNPAWFQPGATHGLGMGVTKHGRAGAHGRKAAKHSTKLGRRHGSPMPAMRDPFHGKAMGRNKR